MNSGRAPAHYRLRGEVGGASRSYPLRPGENWVGSTSGNAVVLPLRGVSRRHALLTLAPEGLMLEDMGSKNGTLVRGVRIQRTRLQAGDEIRVGPVTLRLEEVEAEDAAIAIRLDAAGAPAAGLPDGDTTATGVDDHGRVSLGLVEGLIARACASPEPDLAGIATLLARGLNARSACVFEVHKGEAVALAASGPVPDLAAHRGFAELSRGAAASAGAVRSASLAGDVPLACAVTAGPGSERLGIVVAGEVGLRRADVEAVLHLLVALLQRLRPRTLAPRPARPADPPGLEFPDGYVPGESQSMRSFYAQMRPLVQGDLPVLLLGETGVGKEFLARILHDSSRRRGGPFVAINCAAIPADLLEAEMFGIGKGIATGVVERRGKFQMAEGGTLLLDEIGDMPLELQAKLLRALQEKEVQPVGGAPVPVDIRVIAATNSDLHRRMEEGRFRRDLYFRVAGFALRVPPLRERREDVPALVERFLRAFARETGKGVHGITVKALRALIEYAWPGNVRELEHEVRRLVYLCPAGEAIDSTMISPQVAAGVAEAGAGPPAIDTLELETNVEALERRLIREALGRSGGNRSQAARLLGVSRNGLAIKMERLGIGVSD
ncbi:MAG TPA: sigma 54-interacting transcriptional regulator [Vicinamibacteria bacterium]|nr:sigma 54-interacting transcriptional regulator [Vicinamibacteria bacterium]